MADERVSDELLADVAWRYPGGDVALMARELQERRRVSDHVVQCPSCFGLSQLIVRCGGGADDGPMTCRQCGTRLHYRTQPHKCITAERRRAERDIHARTDP